MENKYKYLVAGFALILFVLPSVIGFQLPSPNEPRDCYKWGQTEGLYMCFEPGTGTYAMWFTSYIEMNEYYTPQLVEYNWSIGNIQISGKKIIGESKNIKSDIGTLMITGSPSYSYINH